jgi:hypothetical protein
MCYLRRGVECPITAQVLSNMEDRHLPFGQFTNVVGLTETHDLQASFAEDRFRGCRKARAGCFVSAMADSGENVEGGLRCS